MVIDFNFNIFLNFLWHILELLQNISRTWLTEAIIFRKLYFESWLPEVTTAIPLLDLDFGRCWKISYRISTFEYNYGNHLALRKSTSDFNDLRKSTSECGSFSLATEVHFRNLSLSTEVNFQKHFYYGSCHFQKLFSYGSHHFRKPCSTEVTTFEM